MTDHLRATVYAVEKVGPVDVGAGRGTDYICKVFARTPKFSVVVSVAPDSYEGYARALLNGSPSEVLCDPSKVLGVQLNEHKLYSDDTTREAIATVREKSVRTT